MTLADTPRPPTTSRHGDNGDAQRFSILISPVGGIVADGILWTEGQIGVMADRIVYVTEVSQDNFVQAI
ncbi:MAG TPA: hypothetical protein VFY84_05280 [Jiangellales bacterium]|nr:hypothetical protein [Jiangellales bacterium]